MSTYPTMMGMINEARLPANEAQRRFGVGHFDLLIIDEAHRSVFQKYRTIFEYFDSLLVGLTATPKEDIDRNTYTLFDLEKGVPTDAYGLDEAVRDGFLVPTRAVSVPLKFQREGIRYSDLTEEAKDQWDALEWDDPDGSPDAVEAEAINTWLFNTDTVDKALAHLMTRGVHVDGGDRLGKTIIFAKNQKHADFIEDRFNVNYPKMKGDFARVITFKVEYAQSLIDSFSTPSKAPHIAISVDMLDTGIDVPEVVNLVFFKIVRSRTKFWQMVGRGTRLCRELFGPGEHKQFFYLFDYCQNLEFFSANPETTDGTASPSLGKRLFTRRLDVIAELDRKRERDKHPAGAAEPDLAALRDPVTDVEVRDALAMDLHGQVAAMNLDNFVVRPRRRVIEAYRDSAAWVKLPAEARAELAKEVAGLPSEQPSEPEEAKRFDLLMFSLMLARLKAQPAFARLRGQVEEIAVLLEGQSSIPMIREQLPIIAEIQTDGWWQDVTVPMLERVRRRLRGLVKLLEKQQRTVLYTNIPDEQGDSVEVALPVFACAGDLQKFRDKARVFLRAHTDHVAIAKLRMNRPLTGADLVELERMLAESGVGPREDLDHARTASEGLGLFVRSLVGLDREAAKEALGGFLSGKTPGANQIVFVNLIVDHLTEHGVMTPSLLYESPFTDITPRGPEGIFNETQVKDLVAVLERVKAAARGG